MYIVNCFHVVGPLHPDSAALELVSVSRLPLWTESGRWVGQEQLGAVEVRGITSSQSRGGGGGEGRGGLEPVTHWFNTTAPHHPHTVHQQLRFLMDATRVVAVLSCCAHLAFTDIHANTR